MQLFNENKTPQDHIISKWTSRDDQEHKSETLRIVIDQLSIYGEILREEIKFRFQAPITTRCLIIISLFINRKELGFDLIARLIAQNNNNKQSARKRNLTIRICSRSIHIRSSSRLRSRRCSWIKTGYYYTIDHL